MSRLLYRVGHSAGRHPWRVLAVWLLIAVSAFVLNGAVGGAANDTFSLPGAEAQAGADKLTDRFPAQSVYSSQVVLHSDEGLTTRATQLAVADAVEGLADVPHVVDVSSPYDPRGPTISEDGTTGFVTVAFDTDKIELPEFEAAESATKVLRDADIQVEYNGLLGVAKGDEEPGSEMIGIAVAIIVLAIAFGSLVAMSLPIAVALIGLLVGSSSIGILSGYLTVPSITTIVASMLGLGVGIDYALFILARHRQHLDEGMPVPEAVGRANATAGLSVLFAGVTVVVAIAGLQVAGIPMLTMMGWGSALMVGIVMLAAVTLLPGLLGLAGRRVNSLRVPFVRQRPANDPDSRSARWAARVVARPVRYGVVAVVLLGVLATPVAAMRIGFSDDGNLAKESTLRKSYDLLADGFGPGFNGPVQVAVETDGSADDAATVEGIAAAIAADPGIASVSPTAVSPQGDLAVIVAQPTTGPQEAETTELVDRLRADVIPEAVAGHDMTTYVTGGTAFAVDISERFSQRMLWFIGAVIGLSFVVLMIVFRSLLVPLKAAVLNLISIGAAYGVLVAVFQWGWGASLIGVHETVPINPLAPMLMFAILFGLSMDYEVFLLSRVREQYLKHRDPKRAVVEGVGSTARVITSAALIMISVFGAFILSPDVTTKLFGVGLGVAVLLDVTLVRMILVPAAMSLLGHRAWWLPRSLDRMLPTIDLEGTHAATVILPAPRAAGDDETEDEEELVREPALV
jgi:putative drug exporter of the RND superfamily